jgi:hypothetical protein
MQSARRERSAARHAQLHLASVKAALERCRPDCENGRGFLGREALEITEDDRGAQFGGEPRQRLGQDRFELAVEHPRLWSETRGVWNRRDKTVDFDAGVERRRRAARQASLCFVERDPVKPSRQPRAPLEARQAPPRPEEHLLRDVLGLLGVEPEPSQGSVDLGGVSDDDLRERVLVTGSGTLDQRLLAIM